MPSNVEIHYLKRRKNNDDQDTQGTKIKDNYYSVVEDKAALHGQSTVHFCQELLEFAIKDIAANDPEHISKVMCEA